MQADRQTTEEPEVKAVSNDPWDMARAALLRVHKSLRNPTKNKTNPFHKNKYADLGIVLEGLKSELLEEGFVLSQDGTLRQSNLQNSSLPFIAVATQLLHAPTGKSFLYQVDVPLKEASPQGGMSALTYGRRYGLLSAFGLVAEDDDGEMASGRDEFANIGIGKITLPKSSEDKAEEERINKAKSNLDKLVGTNYQGRGK